MKHWAVYLILKIVLIYAFTVQSQTLEANIASVNQDSPTIFSLTFVVSTPLTINVSKLDNMALQWFVTSVQKGTSFRPITKVVWLTVLQPIVPNALKQPTVTAKFVTTGSMSTKPLMLVIHVQFQIARLVIIDSASSVWLDISWCPMEVNAWVTFVRVILFSMDFRAHAHKVLTLPITPAKHVKSKNVNGVTLMDV